MHTIRPETVLSCPCKTLQMASQPSEGLMACRRLTLQMASQPSEGLMACRRFHGLQKSFMTFSWPHGLQKALWPSERLMAF